jgi:hypothetical protein
MCRVRAHNSSRQYNLIIKKKKKKAERGGRDTQQKNKEAARITVVVGNKKDACADLLSLLWLEAKKCGGGAGKKMCFCSAAEMVLNEWISHIL